MTGSALGVVMGGGGARAAYQVGVLRALAEWYPDISVPYITGVSAGAINAAHLAAHHGSFEQSVEELSELWGNLQVENVFQVGATSLFGILVRWGLRLVSGDGGAFPR